NLFQFEAAWHLEATHALHAAHSAHHLGHSALLHLLHHALHLLELIQQAVNLLHGHARPLCNAAFARSLKDLGLGAFGMGHGIEYAQHTSHLLLGLPAFQLA